MTRKQYINKAQVLVIAIHKTIHKTSHKRYKLGNALRTFRDGAKNVPGEFGSYEAAWNCDAMRFARKHYLGEEC